MRDRKIEKMPSVPDEVPVIASDLEKSVGNIARLDRYDRCMTVISTAANGDILIRNVSHRWWALPLAPQVLAIVAVFAVGLICGFWFRTSIGQVWNYLVIELLKALNAMNISM